MNARIIALFLGLFLSISGKAQQAWTDYTLNIPFGNNYVFTNQLAYHTNLDQDEKWRNYAIEPGVERKLNEWCEVMLAVSAEYTVQKEGYDTKEIKPFIGTRFHITPKNRVLVRTLIRFEYRNQFEDHLWSHSMRSRFRLESIVPINRQHFSDDNVWYGLADAEVFWVMDQHLDERYANQERYRIGLGYRPSYSWRFELIYTNQQSKNTIEDGASEGTNILRFRVKHFLNKKKPATWHPNSD